MLQGLKHSGKVLVRQEMVQGDCCSVVELVFFSNLPVNTLKSLSNGFSFCRRGTLVGCRLWGRIESDTTEVT